MESHTRIYLLPHLCWSSETKGSRKETVSDRSRLVHDPIESWTLDRDKSVGLLAVRSLSLSFLCSIHPYFQFSRYIRPLAIEDKTFSSLSWPGCLPASLLLSMTVLPLHTAALLESSPFFSTIFPSFSPLPVYVAHATYTFTPRREK